MYRDNKCRYYWEKEPDDMPDEITGELLDDRVKDISDPIVCESCGEIKERNKCLMFKWGRKLYWLCHDCHYNTPTFNR